MKSKEDTLQSNTSQPHTSQKQRPVSDSTQSITIRSYLGRFLSQQSGPSICLNPIVTSATSNEKQNQIKSTRSTQSFYKTVSTHNLEKRNVLPFGTNYTALHRPKVNDRRPPGPTRTFHGSVIEQEIRALTRGQETDNSRVERVEKRDKQIFGGYDAVNLEHRSGHSNIVSPPQGPIMHSQGFSNLTRYSKKDTAVGLSIVSTPAPVQYKDEVIAKPAIGEVCSGALETSGVCR